MTFKDSLTAFRRQALGLAYVSVDSFARTSLRSTPSPAVASPRKAIFFAFFVVLPILTGCDKQVVVRGQVVAATGLPAAAVRVTLTRGTDSHLSTTTDALGCFSLDYADGDWDPRDPPLTIAALHRDLGTSTITTTRGTINGILVRITLGQDTVTTAPTDACATSLVPAATEEIRP